MSVNKAILIGRLGKDPELRSTPAGQAVARFTLATNEYFNDKSGQRQERTEWHNIVAWGRLAETVSQYLKKGRTAYVEGRISTRQWDDRDGNKRSTTEIVALTIQFLDGGSRAGAGGAPAEPATPQDQSFPGATQSGDFAGSAGNSPVAEDDLPF